MKRPDPIDEPTYNWPTGRAGDDATPVEKALAALKVGALLAGTVTIAFIYLSTYGGNEVQGDLASVLVLAAFLLPSLIVVAGAACPAPPAGPAGGPPGCRLTPVAAGARAAATGASAAGVFLPDC